jgi:hypothetical protein
MSSSS